MSEAIWRIVGKLLFRLALIAGAVILMLNGHPVAGAFLIVVIYLTLEA